MKFGRDWRDRHRLQDSHGPHGGLELGRAEIPKRRVQALPIVDVLDERTDLAARVGDITIGTASTSSRLSVFMKLSALALS